MLELLKKEFRIYSVLQNTKATAQNRNGKKICNNKWGATEACALTKAPGAIERMADK